jgi:hypothetical protein
MSIAVADMRQAGHKAFHRLGNAPAAPKPSGQPIRRRIAIPEQMAFTGSSMFWALARTRGAAHNATHFLLSKLQGRSGVSREMLFFIPSSNPRCVQPRRIIKCLAVPNSLVSYCVSTSCYRFDTVEVCGSSPHGSTILFNTLESFLRNPAETSPVNVCLWRGAVISAFPNTDDAQA